jgi:ubiquinone/menaquinone biosynthesis C-methylase UbiE
VLWNVSTRALLMSAAATTVVGLAVVAWKFSFFFLPYSWTSEPSRLAQALRLQAGMRVTDIGAGSGAMAIAMATLVGNSGVVYATELAPDQLAEIESRSRRAGLPNIQVIEAAETETGLPDRCCDAAYMRAVFHHVAHPSAFASDVARALRPGGRLAVIDFAAGALWFHGADHGVSPASVQRAFESAGLRLVTRDDHWGGGMFLLVFEHTDVTSSN